MYEVRYARKLKEEPPEGWRFGHNLFNEQGEAALYLHPDWPNTVESKWIEYETWQERRYCGEWERIPE